MKKAVILSNHYRSFEYIADYLKNFFGKDTDFYICTWDHQFNYENQTVKNSYGFKVKSDAQLSPYMYKPLNLKKIESFIQEFNPKDYKILTDKEFDTWAEKMPNVPKQDKYYSRYILGGMLPPKICADMIRNSGISYDLIFKSRMDIIPLMRSGSFNTFCQSLMDSRPRTILTNLLKFKDGLPYMNDRFWCGKGDTVLDFFNDIENKIDTIFSLKFFQGRSIINHMLYGTLMLFTQANLKFNDQIYDEIIRKDFVDMKFELGNVADHKKALDTKRKTKEVF